jgi:hypothetical protein
MCYEALLLLLSLSLSLSLLLVSQTILDNSNLHYFEKLIESPEAGYYV